MPEDDDDPDDRETPAEPARDPAARLRETADGIRLHAEIAAVFEGVRKFDAVVRPGLSADVARDVQRSMGRLDKARSAETAIVPEASVADANAVLERATAAGLTTNDYHVHRRPGEVMIVRWLEGDEVDSFYDRLQAHFDAAIAGVREQERQEAWRQDETAAAYLAALDALDVRMATQYRRDAIRTHGVALLSTQTADEMNIAYLCDGVMGVPAVEVVGGASAPPEDGAAERDLAWFYKLFLLRGQSGGVERMCFFTYLQKSDDSEDFE